MKLLKKLISKKTNPKVLVWGCGKTGLSILNFLKTQNNTLFAIDKKHNLEAEKITKSTGGSFNLEDKLDYLLEQIDAIIPSPGIVLPKRIANSEKLVCELDLFYSIWKGPITAITGSIGKTSTTSFLYQILKLNGNDICIGGNIGIPMIDLCTNENIKKPFILEVSSAQLEHSKIFSPKNLIWTNIFENHIDYHGTFEKYIKAKARILINNPSNIEYAVINKETKDILKKYNLLPKLKNLITTSDLTKNTHDTNTAYYNREGFHIYKNLILKNALIPSFSHKSNWLSIATLLYKTGIDIKKAFEKIKDKKLDQPEHRLEYCGTISDNIHVYNDSKSTIMESTISAVNQINEKHQNKPITLLIGGLSKGVDRSKYLKALLNNTKHIIVFGKKRFEFIEYANKNEIAICESIDTKDAIKLAKKITLADGVILFSPGGSSFDEFSSFEKRGKYFKSIIHLIEIKN
jgi:UDP-N-acetylmuramoylalanine--D-glutamate ligase